MASQAGTFASGTQSASGGSASWFNYSGTQLQSVDGSDANCTIGASGLSYALAASFTFTGGNAIPLGSTINGFSVTITREASGSGIVDDSVLLSICNGAYGSSNLSAGGTWPTSMTGASYGGASNLCGISSANATVANVNAGCSASVQAQNSSGSSLSAYVDQIALTVYYTLGTNQVIPQSITVVGVPEWAYRNRD